MEGEGVLFEKQDSWNREREIVEVMMQTRGRAGLLYTSLMNLGLCQDRNPWRLGFH
jgi:hypothetical protein